MRDITSDDILKNKYSFESGCIIKSENGEFYNIQIATQALKYYKSNDFKAIEKLKKLDKIQKDSDVEKICLERYIETKSEKQNKLEFDMKPLKKYEIYRLCSKSEKIMLCNTKYFYDSDEKEIYYDKNIAIKIYETMIELSENIINSFPELLEMYEEEIMKKQEEIEKLKFEDELKYQNILKEYEVINGLSIFQDMKDTYQLNKEENNVLRKKLEKSNNIIKDLSKKLQFSLNKYEELKYRKSSIRRIIKQLLNKQDV